MTDWSQRNIADYTPYMVQFRMLMNFGKIEVWEADMETWLARIHDLVELEGLKIHSLVSWDYLDGDKIPATLWIEEMEHREAVEAPSYIPPEPHVPPGPDFDPHGLCLSCGDPVPLGAVAGSVCDHCSNHGVW
jgi:hypothetical protein